MDIIILYGARPRCVTWLYQALKMCTRITAGCWESNEAGIGIVFLSQICTSLSKNADCLSRIYFPESLHLLENCPRPNVHLPQVILGKPVALTVMNKQCMLQQTDMSQRQTNKIDPMRPSLRGSRMGEWIKHGNFTN